MTSLFRTFAQQTSRIMGLPWSFLVACVVIIVWAASGPLFGFSDTWQLVINTGTTIVTFLMVFLIQNTQNRDSKSIQLKLDELIRGVSGARTDLVGLEELTDEQLDELQAQFMRIRRRHNGGGAHDPAVPKAPAASAQRGTPPSSRSGTRRRRRSRTDVTSA